MKKLLIALFLILPGALAQAGEFRSLTDLGLCSDGTKVSRFLDGDRVKFEGFTVGEDDYRSCSVVKDLGDNKVYVCGTDSWKVMEGEGDLQVQVHISPIANQVRIINRSNEVLFQGICHPRN